MLKVDSNISFEQAVAGAAAPKHIVDSLCLIDVHYWSFDDCLHQGQLLIHEDTAQDVLAIFALIEKTRFPIGKVIPIVKYSWSDEVSMADNNTSAFNYRTIKGTNKPSHHGTGRALDINPFQNPVIYSDGRILPTGAVYDLRHKGTLFVDSPVVREFMARGWRWGGCFESLRDYHHFERPQT
jgi:hypothetical protein